MCSFKFVQVQYKKHFKKCSLYQIKLYCSTQPITVQNWLKGKIKIIRIFSPMTILLSYLWRNPNKSWKLLSANINGMSKEPLSPSTPKSTLLFKLQSDFCGTVITSAWNYCSILGKWFLLQIRHQFRTSHHHLYLTAWNLTFYIVGIYIYICIYTTEG